MRRSALRLVPPVVVSLIGPALAGAGEASQAFDALAKRIDDLGAGRQAHPELKIS